MKKTLFIFMFSINIAYSQQFFQENFSINPISNGWDFYNNGSAGNFTHSSEKINTQINAFQYEGTQSTFYHKNLGDSIARFCATFKITNKSISGSDNSFFPLLLTESNPQLPNNHPWRLNATNGSSANICQSIGLVGVIATHDEIRFISRLATDAQNFVITAFSTPYFLNYNQDTWIRLSYVSETSAKLEVSENANFTSTIRSEIFNMPDIGFLSQLYISNCNGNWTTNVNYDLDDYFVSFTNDCEILDIKEKENVTTNLLQFNVFPNPNNGSFEIEISEITKELVLLIYDASGKIIKTKIVQKGINFKEKIELESGSYLISVNDGENNTVKKIIIL